ncbi:MAG TPA: hypothetical protein VMW93_00490 [bacterium]|nr:hypothetical protein [bacterium]
MRNLTVFILVALFACGGLLLVGCKKKEAPAPPTAETGTVVPEPTAEPAPTAEPPGTATTGEEMPTTEGQPGEGGQ